MQSAADYYRRIGILKFADYCSRILLSYQVVGVVNDTRSGGRGGKTKPTFIFPLQKATRVASRWCVRIDGNEANVISALSRATEASTLMLIVSAQQIADRVYIQITPFRAIALLPAQLGILGPAIGIDWSVRA